MTSQILGFVAIVALLLAAGLGGNALKKNAGLRVAIGTLLFTSVAALITAYVREPWVIWPLGFLMLGAMMFMVRTMHQQIKGSRG